MRNLRINDWYVQPGDNNTFLLKGATEAAEEGVVAEAEHISTPLTAINFQDGVAQTGETLYNLGTPAQVMPKPIVA